MVYLLCLLFFLLLFKKGWVNYFLLNVPIIDALHNILPGKQIGNEYIKIASLLIVFIVFYVKNRTLISKKVIKPTAFYFLNLFTIIILLSLINTSDFFFSLPYVLNFINVLLAFKVYYYFFLKFQNKVIFNQFIDKCFIAAFIWILNIYVCTFFQYGNYDNDYEGIQLIYYGHTNFYNIYPLAYLVLLFPYMLFIKKKRISSMIALISSLIAFLLIAKRTYLSIIVISLCVGLIFYYVKTKKMLSLISIIVFMLLVYYSFGYIFVGTFMNTRGNALSRSYFEEGRFYELASYRDEMTSDGSLSNLLVGKEIFHSQGKFFSNSSFNWLKYDTKRILHSDYAHILYGTGVLGIITYLLFFVSIAYFFIKISLIKYENESTIIIKSLFWGIFLALVINGFSDGILGFSNRLIPFMLLGTLISNLARNNNFYHNLSTYRPLKMEGQ